MRLLFLAWIALAAMLLAASGLTRAASASSGSPAHHAAHR